MTINGHDRQNAPRGAAYHSGTALGYFILMLIKALLAMVPVWWIWSWLAPHLNAPELSLGEVYGALVLIGLVALVARTEDI